MNDLPFFGDVLQHSVIGDDVAFEARSERLTQGGFRIQE